MGSMISGGGSPDYGPTRTIIREVPVYREKTTETNSEDASKDTSKQRSDNLLRRQRGRFGTVLTGFRGVLSQKSDSSNSRKTLLGE